MLTVKVIKYFRLKGTAIPQSQHEIWKNITLAYQTATDHEPNTKEVLIRSTVHNSTSINGKYQRDPEGYHLTISHKNEDQVQKKTHVSSHGYVTDATSFKLKEATHVKEKLDSYRKRNGKPVWPTKFEPGEKQRGILVEVMEVAYSYPKS
ncbi:hypothetical protein F4814DRAFT_452456 [Daldinia grandis]|nr:hypothetical protein F4814DRAFT_452456 [Daldinia grandis]